MLRLTVPAIGRRLFIAGVATVAVAMPATLGLVQAAPAAASVRDPSVCRMLPVPAAIVFGDPVALYPILGGYYSRARGIAYEATGQFPHSTTLSFNGYDDYGFLDTPNRNTLNDANITPDRGSVNPFVVGNRVNAPKRNYTVWFYPTGFRVPRRFKNVVRFPTVPADPTDHKIIFSVLMRMYQAQPGYSLRKFIPTIHAVSAANPRVRVRCPLTLRSDRKAFLGSFRLWNKAFGPAEAPPEPPGNRVLFTRPPYQNVSFPEGYPTDHAIGYLIATPDLSKISVVTWHKVATYFNNQILNPLSIMGDYQARWMSEVVTTVPESRLVSVNQDNAIYQPDGSWVTVYLPSQPRLSLAQITAVRAKAAMLGYNVIQEPRPIPGIPIPTLINIRQKVPNPTFCCSLMNVPSWTDPNNPATANNNWRDFPKQNSPQFFATYYSNPKNMGPYYIDGVKETFAEFMQP